MKTNNISKFEDRVKNNWAVWFKFFLVNNIKQDIMEYIEKEANDLNLDLSEPEVWSIVNENIISLMPAKPVKAVK